jgi:antitoxin (DNA-binding transcriptional repressor) of toxin-antitoxin stability system
MSTRVGIAELKDRLSEHLRAVESGSEVIVLDRKRPIARIVPMPATGAARLRVIQPGRPFASVRDRRRIPARWPVSSTEFLMEERRET